MCQKYLASLIKKICFEFLKKANRYSSALYFNSSFLHLMCKLFPQSRSVHISFIFLISQLSLCKMAANKISLHFFRLRISVSFHICFHLNLNFFSEKLLRTESETKKKYFIKFCSAHIYSKHS